ncbi:MAG: spore germination protein [Faecalibacterium sp.]|nr:spore germination protein [Ruminococcus sp.]MCM1392065.1 spore germination protein [Ruminococcus sp.]MCM1484990.1 spore germination protein [Faecalibacterium sp.]
MNDFNKKYEDNLIMVNRKLRVGECFDMIVKRIKLGSQRATFYCIDGFVKDEMFEKMLEYLSNLTEKQMEKISDADEFLNTHITYIESSTEDDIEKFTTFVLSGAIGMIVEGFDKAIIIDSRTYPARDVQEPESDKVLRGSHEGFVETIIFNTALIRRKIRNPQLTLKSFQVGRESKTDIVVCYLENTVDKKQLDAVIKKLKSIDVKSLTMSQESLRECLLPYQPWNPFPKVRYTERPDAAAACIYDGNVIILADGSPSAMIIPTGIFDFVQDINDYYFPPMIGSFLRYVRAVVFGLSLLLVPSWYLITLYADRVPDSMNFILVNEPNGVPLIFQLLVTEFVIDTLRLASLNTPSALSNSFSVIGALVLGEFGVSSGLFVSEIVLFMAFSAISNFTQPSYELGYAIKVSRVFILVMTAIFKFWGFIAALAIITLVICTTKTLGGYNYLYPIIPFNGKALKSLLVRSSLKCTYKGNENVVSIDAASKK